MQFRNTIQSKYILYSMGCSNFKHFPIQKTTATWAGWTNLETEPSWENQEHNDKYGKHKCKVSLLPQA